MADTVADLVKRVGRILKSQNEWFELIAKWYESAEQARDVLGKLWLPGAPTCKPKLSANGKFADEIARTSEHSFYWIVPTSMLRPGDNDVVLWIDPQSGPPVAIGTVSVERAALLPPDARRDSRPTPVPSEQAAVAVRLSDGFGERDRCTAHIDGNTLTLGLKLNGLVPTALTVGVAVVLPGSGQVINLELLWTLVADLVEKKITELLEQRRKGKPVARDLQDLEAYDKLHHGPLKKAVQGSGNVKSRDALDQSGKQAKSAPPAKPSPAKQPQMLSGCSWFLLLVAIVVVVAWGNGWIGRGVLGTAWSSLWDRSKNTGQRAREQEISQVLAKKGAQSGEVQVSLYWTNKNDLDLHVIPPSGERISYQHRQSRCKGTIDVDMNVSYPNASAQAVENVFWPANQAPPGRYKVEVHYFRNHGQPDCKDPTPFTVRVVSKGATQWFHGELSLASRNTISLHEFDVK